MQKNVRLFLRLVAAVLLWVPTLSLAADNVPVIAATQNSSPKYFDPDSAAKGVCGDIYDSLARRMINHGIAVTADPIQLPIKRILHNLETGKMHMFCGAGRNAKREKLFQYSTNPVWHTSNVVITSKANPVDHLTFKQLATGQTIVGAYFGTSSSRFLMKQPGIQVDDSYKSLKAALQDVARGHLPYFYYHDLGLNYLLLQHPELPARVVPTKFRTVPQWIIFSRHLDDSVYQALDAQITDLAESGDIDMIMARYRPGS